MNNIRFSRGLVNQLDPPDNQATSVRLTLTPQAFRNDKFDFYTGQFANGYPFNSVYYFCDQNLTITHKYGSLQWGRNSTAGSYPSLSSTYIIDGQNIFGSCGSNPTCNTVCPSGSVLDPSSCICVVPDECIPQPSCSPTPIPLNLKSVIYGYAFYVDSYRSVNIPGIGNIPATCWGGHVCCRTRFQPRLVLQNGTVVNANRNISMDNVNLSAFNGPLPPGYTCSFNSQIPAPNFVPNTPYEISDTFQFVVNNASDFIDAGVYLQCLLPNNSCHNGVTMIVLVGETTDNVPTLLFSSCVSPGSLNVKPLGTIDCNTDSQYAEPCIPPPPPPPPPPPSPSPPPSDIWRISDGTTIYAQGIVSSGVLSDFPSPFEPLYYDSTGGKTFILSASCSGINSVLSTWEDDISICGTSSDRWPSYTATGPWPLPSPCEGEFIVGTPYGDGQEWRNPNHEIAVTFTGSEDGEWTNLNNWQDANNRSPARYLPNISSNVIIAADVTSVPSNYSVSVNSLTINSGSNFAIEATCSDLVCYGTIDRPVSPVCDGKYGKVTYTSSAIFSITGSIVDGAEVIQGEGATDAIFNDTSLNDGTLYGSAIFNNSSSNISIVTGNAVFNNTSFNSGLVSGFATFNDSSYNDILPPPGGSSVNGGAEFNDTSYNKGGVSGGPITFNDSSYNDTTGQLNGNPTTTFNNNSENRGNAGTATFNDYSKNTSTGSSGFPTFNNNAENLGTIMVNGTFNNFSINNTGGTVNGNASFNNDSINRGSVTNTATFNDNACNDGGTATTFVPDPPPPCA